MATKNCVTRQDVQQTLNHTNEDSNLPARNINLKMEQPIKYSEQLENVRNLLNNAHAQHNQPSLKPLEMVDALQKLCINHHFQHEIDSILKTHYTKITDSHFYQQQYDQSLYEVSCNFRILRQNGYNVLPGVFANFKQKNGRFMEEIAQDVRGLIALHEASQLSIEGEHILEEAADFSTHALKEMMPFLDEDEAIMVKNTLQRTPSPFMVKKFIKQYTGTAMSELAKLELAKVRSLHRREVAQISRWWKELGLAQELKLARSQPLYWYLWPMASLADPVLSEQRLELTKPIALIFIIDDIFDVYGTLDELILFTEAVVRWDINSLEGVSYHLRICIEALFNITHEISDNIYKKYGFNPIEYLKRTWIKLCEAFLVEAKWFASGHFPTAEDYLRNGIVSCGAEVVTTHMFFLLGGATDEDSAMIINDNPGITNCCAKILRLWDDLGCAKDENQDGHDGSYVTYYMRENEGCSIENARGHVMGMISDTWKQFNKECLSPNNDLFSSTFIKACLNIARMVPIMYDYDENHSRRPILEDYINSMF